MGMLYIIIMYDMGMLYNNMCMNYIYIINYVWWMGMLYIIIMYDEWVCYIHNNYVW